MDRALTDRFLGPVFESIWSTDFEIFTEYGNDEKVSNPQSRLLICKNKHELANRPQISDMQMCGIQQGYAELETHVWQTRACKLSNLTTGRYDIFITA